MKNEGAGLYLSRKSGVRMPRRYVLSHYAPSLIVFLIVLTLTFVMVFISSMTDAIERMIVFLGCGTITTDCRADISEYEGARIDSVREGDGIIYASGGKSLVHIKGVDEKEYFSGERGKALRLSLAPEEYRNGIIISSTLQKALDLKTGDKLTLLLYDALAGRARPLLMTVQGIFSSGYAQLDRYLCYTEASLVDADERWEILLPQSADTEEVLRELGEKGIYGESYRDRYSSLVLNVDQSIMILNVILIAVALLAAFFSADIAHVYTSRDRKDIAALRLMGMSEKDVRILYRRMSVLSVAVSSLLGTAGGLLLSLFSPFLISFVAMREPAVVEYYISSFSLVIPVRSIAIMLVLMILCSSLTLRIELLRTGVREIAYEIKGE